MKRVLDPVSRVSEVLFGVIMVLTFTGSLSVATAGRAEVRAMLAGALGCNLAWGVIDAILHLLGVLAQRGEGLAALRALHRARTPEEGRTVVAEALPPVVASVLEPAELETMRGRLAALPAPAERARLGRDDGWGALGVFLLVFLTTLPVAVPFLFLRDAHFALRVSNGVAIAILYVCGHVMGRLTGYSPWWTGLGMVLLGAALVGMTMALGG